eukprot:1265664-Ditylum_brightwellii.AAC.1
MTKAKMGDKGTPYKEKKTSSVDNNTTKEDEKRNVFQKGSGKVGHLFLFLVQNLLTTHHHQATKVL